jgi:hypothetical protein
LKAEIHGKPRLLKPLRQESEFHCAIITRIGGRDSSVNSGSNLA